MKLLTTASITHEALKILNDTYTKQNRKQIGGNEYVHNVQREATTNSTGTAEKNLLF
jgi:hypothetical protein